MIPFSSIKTIFFDYDGTLHNSMKIYGPAFRKAFDFLVKEGYAKERTWSDKDISYWLGFNPEEMWAKFMPELDTDIKDKSSSIIGNELKKYTEKGIPELYDGALETLEYLKKKEYNLIFLSNCKIQYKNAHKDLFHLDQYFDELVCSEEYSFIPKSEILNKIKLKYNKEMVIIGDRIHDMEAGRKNEIYTIGCSYGFHLEGELEKSDFIIDDIRDLRNYL